VGVTADKFPYLSNNDLKGKAQLTLDEARSFQLLLTGYFFSVHFTRFEAIIEVEGQVRNVITTVMFIVSIVY